jgi:hypothetical protein
VTFFWAGSVNVPANEPIEFRRYRAPPALRRGTCAKCGNPVVAFLKLVSGLTAAFVPSQNFPRAAELPAPRRHIFYDRRVANAADSIPKLRGYWASEVYVTRTMFADLLRPSRAA